MDKRFIQRLVWLIATVLALRHTGLGQTSKQVDIIRDAEVLVFDGCSSFDEKTRPYCWTSAIYTLNYPLTEGVIQVFNDLHVDAEYPLPDLSAGKHVTTIAGPGFYWSEKNDTLPDPMFFFVLGTSWINDSIGNLWSESDVSAYDYKPEACEKHPEDLCDLAAAFRGDDVAIVTMTYPGKRNLKLRVAGDLPEVEIMGVGFSEGTEVECGRGGNPNGRYKAALRDVHVISTVSHDADPDIPVLKVGRFTVPKEVFEYRGHIRIVGKVKK
jgi:hypothetical protein